MYKKRTNLLKYNLTIAKIAGLILMTLLHDWRGKCQPTRPLAPPIRQTSHFEKTNMVVTRDVLCSRAAATRLKTHRARV